MANTDASITFRVTSTEKEEIERAARDLGVSLTKVVRDLIMKYIEQNPESIQIKQSSICSKEKRDSKITIRIDSDTKNALLKALDKDTAISNILCYCLFQGNYLNELTPTEQQTSSVADEPHEKHQTRKIYIYLAYDYKNYRYEKYDPDNQKFDIIKKCLDLIEEKLREYGFEGIERKDRYIGILYDKPLQILSRKLQYDLQAELSTDEIKEMVIERNSGKDSRRHLIRSSEKPNVFEEALNKKEEITKRAKTLLRDVDINGL